MLIPVRRMMRVYLKSNSIIKLTEFTYFHLAHGLQQCLRAIRNCEICVQEILDQVVPRFNFVCYIITKLASAGPAASNLHINLNIDIYADR